MAIDLLNQYRRSRNGWMAIVLLAALVVLFFLPISLPNRVTLRGYILPYQDWVLTKDGDNALSATFRNHLNGRVEGYTVHRFERGEVAQLRMSKNGLFSDVIEAGDTVAAIFSSSFLEEKADMEGALSTALASLALTRSGKKDAVLHELQMEVVRVEEEAHQHQRELDRLERLRDSDLISQEEWEIAQSGQRVLEAEIAVAKARVASSTAGARPEKIADAEALVRAAQNDLQALSERIQRFTLTAPISGKIGDIASGDTLLYVRDTTALVVVIPVPLAEKKRYEQVEKISIESPAHDGMVLSGSLYFTESVVHRNNQQYLLAKVRLTNPPDAYLPGMVIKCSFSFEPLSVKSWVIHSFFPDSIAR